ncbi:MAG: matrixin family metalloprotease [Candidatus Dojkabacteria bacterium]
MAVRPLLVLSALLSLCASSPAYAYCRTHTDDPPASSCPEQCAKAGFPLAWATPDLTYSFNQRLFPGIAEGNLRDIMAASFQTWENVRCDGEVVGLDIRARSATTALELGPKTAEPNENVIVHFDASDWADEDLPARAFAITAVWFDSKNGDILGADMMFNGGMDPFGECSPDGCKAGEPNTDLRNVATHEAGHFLGLSHSDVPNSTMWCDADPQETSKRSLSPDDILGLCAVYPPGESFLSSKGSKSSLGHSCSVADAGKTPLAGLGSALLVGLALCLGSRRRRSSRAVRS